MIWTNEDKLIMYVGQIIEPNLFPFLAPTIPILPPLVDVVGLACGTTDSSKLYFIQGKDMNVRELAIAKYHKNSKHITVETPFRIYTTDKKALFDYYKKQFHKGIQYIETNINITMQKYALKSMQEYREKKINAMNTYRQTIETIKKL